MARAQRPERLLQAINLTIHVTTTIPAVASVISNQPTTFTVNISEPADPASLQAGDFSVNGTPASSVAYTPGSTTILFTFPVQSRNDSGTPDHERRLPALSPARPPGIRWRRSPAHSGTTFNCCRWLRQPRR